MKLSRCSSLTLERSADVPPAGVNWKKTRACDCFGGDRAAAQPTCTAGTLWLTSKLVAATTASLFRRHRERSRLAALHAQSRFPEHLRTRIGGGR
jgi:hypothetical protein